MNDIKSKTLLLKQSFLEAVVIAVIASSVAIIVIFFHPEPIPLIARQKYLTIVPCPVSGGSVKPAAVEDLKKHKVYIIDARYKDEFVNWHYKNAKLMTYDYLDPIPEKKLKKLAQDIAETGSKSVIVYGDGDNPDTGELLAKDISGQGIKHVYYLKGGIGSLKKKIQNRNISTPLKENL